jgi:hypothetical protein
MLKSSDSRHSMFRTCGPRDMISLVILRVGDNRNENNAKEDIVLDNGSLNDRLDHHHGIAQDD